MVRTVLKPSETPCLSLVWLILVTMKDNVLRARRFRAEISNNNGGRQLTCPFQNKGSKEIRSGEGKRMRVC